ncbi:hypothetical protein P5673_021721, partial [Acropora cervicornis]
MPSEEIEKSTLLRAIEYVGWAESQKEIFVEFLNELITPTLLTVMTACALFGGPVLTYRAFKQSAPRNIRGVANSEFAAAIRGLEEAGVGKVCSVQIPRVTYPVIVFVKEDPDK